MIEKGQFTRQHSDETAQPRSFVREPNYAPDSAGFCTICGHWNSRLRVVAETHVCRHCNERRHIVAVDPETRVDVDEYRVEDAPGEEPSTRHTPMDRTAFGWHLNNLTGHWNDKFHVTEARQEYYANHELETSEAAALEDALRNFTTEPDDEDLV